jgi:prepilin-type processing-associated H-X9-DG protein
VAQISPFIEEAAAANLGKGLPGDIMSPNSPKKIAIGQAMGIPLKAFYCPSRRAVGTYPSLEPDGTPNQPPYNAVAPPDALYAKTDYAASGGGGFLGRGRGPQPVCYFRYPDCTGWSAPIGGGPNFDGIVGYRQGASIRQITDGTSKTLMAGEKFIPIERYTSGDHVGDDNSMYVGYDVDTIRTASGQLDPNNGAVSGSLPRQDEEAPNASESHGDVWFGGPHGALNVVFCDGSVRTVGYDVDPEAWNGAGRRDGGDTGRERPHDPL